MIACVPQYPNPPSCDPAGLNRDVVSLIHCTSSALGEALNYRCTFLTIIALELNRSSRASLSRRSVVTGTH